MSRLGPPTLLIIIIANATAAAQQPTPRSSRWWFQTHNAGYTTQALEIVKAHRESITGMYCYSGFAIKAGGKFTSPATSVVASRTAPFIALGLTAGVALGLDQSAVQDGSALLAVPAAAAAAKAANLSSLMIDYEPRSNYSLAHAEAYAAFVKSLASALHANDQTLEMCVSSWSILTRFHLYAGTGVDGMMSMASTYFGSNVRKNEGWVAQELMEGVSRDQLRVGIGSTNSIYHKWDYNWTKAELSSFNEWLVTQGVRHLDVWRTDIDGTNATGGTAAWVYETTASFLKEPECTLPGRSCSSDDPSASKPCCGSSVCGGDMAACTDAHLALPHIQTPLFLRENLYDTAKLANCGLNAFGPMSTQQLEYLKAWGGWMRQQLAAFTSALGTRHYNESGYFAPSCLDHGENLDFVTAPTIKGVAVRDALRDWYFAIKTTTPPRLVDDCGGGGLPCTNPGSGRCAHVQPNPLSAQCQARLRADCPGLHGKGQQCDACVRAHAYDLRSHGCPAQGQPVFAWWCDGGSQPKGHHVCDLLLGSSGIGAEQPPPPPLLSPASTTTISSFSSPSPSSSSSCGQLLFHTTYLDNLPSKPTTYAEEVGDCCAFCHKTPGCQFWTWNGPPPGNGLCYAKASSKGAVHSSSATIVSGGITPGPPLPPPPPVQIRLLNRSHALSATEPTYASWNIDSSCNRGFHHIHFNNLNLHAAALGLSPSKLRFGGSGNDYLTYGLSKGSVECKGIPPSPAPNTCGYFSKGCLNASHWDSLHGLASASQSEFIFGLSFDLEKACKHATNSSPPYVWDSSNAASLLSYTASKGQKMYGFELGNEINNHGPGTDCNLTAPMQAGAMATLAKLAATSHPSAVLIGPDSGYRDAQPWLKNYLSDAALPSTLHAVTHHVYPGVSRSDYNHPQKLDSTLAEIGWYTGIVKAFAPKAQVWAGEDGPKGGGNDGTCGKDSICATYASALWYADDLATRAKHGFVQYQRQDLLGAYYGLTASATDHPQTALGASEALLLRPGYWVNFLWKRALGTTVLNLTSTSPYVRTYAFAGKPPSQDAAAECGGHSVLQLLLINLRNESTVLADLSLDAVSPSSKYAAWTLEPVEKAEAEEEEQQRRSQGGLDPFSSRVRLNSAVLPERVDVQAEGAPNFLKAIPVAPTAGVVAQGIDLPPLSVAFVCVNPA